MDIGKLQGELPDVRIGFVLTREGRVWSEEALLHLTETVNEKFPPKEGAAGDSGILWYTGIQLNRPWFLAAMLRKRPDAFVVLSLQESSIILPGSLDTEQTMAEYLEGYADEDFSTWSLLVSNYENREVG